MQATQHCLIGPLRPTLLLLHVCKKEKIKPPAPSFQSSRLPRDRHMLPQHGMRHTCQPPPIRAVCGTHGPDLKAPVEPAVAVKCTTPLHQGAPCCQACHHTVVIEQIMCCSKALCCIGHVASQFCSHSGVMCLSRCLPSTGNAS